MRLPTVLAASLAALLVAGPALAQDDAPRRGERPQRTQRAERLSPEMSKAAWQLQAQHVARGLGLSDEHATQLVKTYVDARRSFTAAVQKMREEARAARDNDLDIDDEGDRGERGARGDRRGGRGFGFGGMNRELIAAESKKLETKLATFLGEKETAKAIVPLGTFNETWDQMVHAVAGFNLDDEKLHNALGHLETYVVTLAKASDSDDRRAMMTTMREARETLDEQLGQILDDEQMASFQRATARGGAGRGGNIAQRLMEFDENGDGKLQKDELPERMQGMFDRLDANGDGVLDAQEIEAAGNRRGRRGPAGRDDF